MGSVLCLLTTNSWFCPEHLTKKEALLISASILTEAFLKILYKLVGVVVNVKLHKYGRMIMRKLCTKKY